MLSCVGPEPCTHVLFMHVLLLLLLHRHWILQEEKVVAHLLAGASFGELALMQVAIIPKQLLSHILLKRACSCIAGIKIQQVSRFWCLVYC